MNTNNATSFAKSIIANALNSSTTLGISWPDSAEFCITNRSSTWPCGWGETTYVSFFENETSFNEYLEHLREWARCEDNYFAYRAYKWDFGPVEIEGSESYRIPTNDSYSANRVSYTPRKTAAEEAEEEQRLQAMYARHDRERLILEMASSPRPQESYW